ncbi:MAG: molybdenum cofactor biosynthesis protein [Deltaproteobacteria bacterium]|nr:MAG: molybdenum cofactor biosynthesis protein [Deltaproteobacteria bacterium]
MIDKRAGVLIVSDKASRGEREDRTGDVIVGILKENGFHVLEKRIVPDERDEIISALKEWSDIRSIPLIITSGGTGVGPRDVTPEATKDIIDYDIPGMGEAMRAKSLQITPNAMLSRAIAGVRKGSLIINLPGSPSGAKDNLLVVMPAIEHALLKISGDTSECV